MTPNDHVKYAEDLLASLEGDGLQAEPFNCAPPDPKRKRNAAKAMTEILCNRLFHSSTNRPAWKKNKNYDWNGGTINCRNIADRHYFWTNLRPGVVNEMHDAAQGMPAAYLMTCCAPDDTMMHTWAVPEPLLHDALLGLRFEEGGKKYTVEIQSDKQRIERCAASPNLSPYYRRFQLRQDEIMLLQQARKADASAKQGKSLASMAKQLDTAGAFDPIGVADARKRGLSSIVRRMGQPTFRKRLLKAYGGQCAITGCDVGPVLDACHIVSYKGPDTNHPANGMLLRTDLHTLFDLKLVAVDAETMTVLVSPELSDTYYEQLRGMQIRVPKKHELRPSREALKQHRQESGL
jgi:hypothetical protein